MVEVILRNARSNDEIQFDHIYTSCFQNLPDIRMQSSPKLLASSEVLTAMFLKNRVF